MRHPLVQSNENNDESSSEEECLIKKYNLYAYNANLPGKKKSKSFGALGENEHLNEEVIRVKRGHHSSSFMGPQLIHASENRREHLLNEIM
jgi:uncharacterized protein YxeA